MTMISILLITLTYAVLWPDSARETFRWLSARNTWLKLFDIVIVAAFFGLIILYILWCLNLSYEFHQRRISWTENLVANGIGIAVMLSLNYFLILITRAVGVLKDDEVAGKDKQAKTSQNISED
jgi:hypothetical protein